MAKDWGKDLYIISADGVLVKVGRSKDIARRFKEVKLAMPWAECRLAASFPDFGFAESLVHKAMLTERKGEWFKASIQDALDAVGRVLTALEKREPEEQ